MHSAHQRSLGGCFGGGGLLTAATRSSQKITAVANETNKLTTGNGQFKMHKRLVKDLNNSIRISDPCT